MAVVEEVQNVLATIPPARRLGVILELVLGLTDQEREELLEQIRLLCG